MLKKIMRIGICLFSLFGLSQEKNNLVNSVENKNELKLNGLFLVLGAIELDYQYLINDESGIGVDVFVAFDDENLSVNYSLTPYYRQYFGKKYASGFFIEGFAMLNSVDDYLYDTINDPAIDSYYSGGGYQENIVDFALGIGTGVKILSKRGFVAEIDLGIGRNLFKNDRDFTIIGKGGISLGYRF